MTKENKLEKLRAQYDDALALVEELEEQIDELENELLEDN